MYVLLYINITSIYLQICVFVNINSYMYFTYNILVLGVYDIVIQYLCMS